MKHNNKGFTLVELMVVVAIVGILAGIAFSVAGGNNEKVRRAIAKNTLMEVQSREEQYFVNNRAYTNDLTDLNYGTSPFFINKNGDEVAQADAFYRISLTVDGFTYTVTATPINAQTKDSCGTLTLNSSSVKTPADCW
ncbi:MAG TPA: type IV pilin protein [Pseudomonadales bacterium]